MIHEELHKITLHKTKIKQQSALYTSSLASTKHKTTKVIIDSGASDNYFPASYNDEAHDDNITPESVGNANGTIMKSVASDRFILEGVPDAARKCKKFVENQIPLVSVGRLCVHGLIVAFDMNSVYIMNKNGQLIVNGHRDPLRNLYLIPIETIDAVPRVPRIGSRLNQQVIAAKVYEIRAVPALILYLHACAGYIPKDTWIAAINAGFYTIWPGLTSARVR